MQTAIVAWKPGRGIFELVEIDHAAFSQRHSVQRPVGSAQLTLVAVYGFVSPLEGQFIIHGASRVQTRAWSIIAGQRER